MLGMQLAIDFVLRDRFVDILERHTDGLFLTRFDHFLDLHAIDGKTVLRRQRDGSGKLIRIDDPKLDPVWKRCGDLGMPVSIHVADPKAFWLPYNPTNERWKELKDHPAWWFGDTNKYPSHEALLGALRRKEYPVFLASATSDSRTPLFQECSACKQSAVSRAIQLSSSAGTT